ncbi:MAG: type III restriction protein res subunit [uncultured bacterium]|nr:MAG: type III restriction protein res subunit [uncultured bacterium]
MLNRITVRHLLKQKLTEYLHSCDENSAPSIVKPKPHQLRILREYLQKLEADANHSACHAVFPLPTGAGKTYLFTLLADLLATSSGKTVNELKQKTQKTMLSGEQPEASRKTLIIVPTLTLMNQTIENLQIFSPHLKSAKLKSQCDDLEDKRVGTLDKDSTSCILNNSDVAVVTYQTLLKHYETIPWEKIGIVTLDEAHHALSKKYVDIIQKSIMPQDCTLLGFTATPIYNLKRKKKSSTAGLASVYELLGYAEDGHDNPIKAIRVKEAIEEKINCPVKCNRVVIPEVENMAANSSEDISEKKAARIIDKENYNLILVDIYANSVSKITGVPFRGKKAVAFCAGIDHSEHVAEIFNQNLLIENIDPLCFLQKQYQINVKIHFLQETKKKFAKTTGLTEQERQNKIEKEANTSIDTFLKKHPFCVAKAVHSRKKENNSESTDTKITSLDQQECREIILQYKLGGTRILTGSDMLKEGFDDPETELVFNPRPTKSEVDEIQRCGRGLRWSKDPKKICEIFDFQWGTTPCCHFVQFLNGKFTVGIDENFHKSMNIPSAPNKIELQKTAKYSIKHKDEGVLRLKPKTKRKATETSQPTGRINKKLKPKREKTIRAVPTIQALQQLNTKTDHAFKLFSETVKFVFSSDMDMASVDERQFESKHNDESMQIDLSLDLMDTNIAAANDSLSTSEIISNEQKQMIEKWKNTVENYKAFFAKFADTSSHVTTEKSVNADVRDSLTSTHVLQQLHTQYTTLINKIERLTNQSLLETFDELKTLDKEVSMLNANLFQHSAQIKTHLQSKQKPSQPNQSQQQEIAIENIFAPSNDIFYLNSQYQDVDMSFMAGMDQIIEEEKIFTWDNNPPFDPNMQIDFSYPYFQDEPIIPSSSQMPIDNTSQFQVIENELPQQPIQPLPQVPADNTLQKAPIMEEHKSEQETIDQEFKKHIAQLNDNFRSKGCGEIINDRLNSISPKLWSDKNSKGQTLLMHMLNQIHNATILQRVIKKIAANKETAKSFAICDSENNTVLHAILSHEPKKQLFIQANFLYTWMELVIKNCPELVKQTNKNKQTPLHLAAQTLLLENKNVHSSLVDEFFKYIESFLQLAEKYNPDLKKNDIINAKDSNGATVFDYAIQSIPKNQNTTLIENLLQHYNIILSDENIDQLKKLAPHHHNLQKILTQKELYCHQLCPSPLTPELITSQTANFAGFVQNSNHLLHALFNTVHFFNGYLPKEINDPLHHSQVKNKCCYFIAKQPAIVNAQNDKGQTPLHLAIFALNKYPADFSEARNYYAASVCQYICILNKILNKCNLTLDLNSQDKEGKTPLDYAIQLNSHDILVNYLLRNGARAHYYQHDARYCQLLQSHIRSVVTLPPPVPNIFANGLTLFQPAPAAIITTTTQSSVSPAYNLNQN